MVGGRGTLRQCSAISGEALAVAVETLAPLVGRRGEVIREPIKAIVRYLAGSIE
jgi:hypothetical protein